MRQPATTGLKFGGIFGFIRCLRGVLERYPYRQCVACWDGGLSARRLHLLPTYKQRDTADTDQDYRNRFRLNRLYLHQLLPLLGVMEVKLDGREADDLIHLSRELLRTLAADAGSSVGAVVISEDRDFLQMVEPDTDIYQPRHDRYVTVHSFEQIAKLPLERFLLFKSVLGDAGDKIPGIKGVGEGTALIVAQEAPLLPAQGQARPEQWDLVPGWCAEHQNKRVRAVTPGWETVLRNYELVALTLEEFGEEERVALRAQLAQAVQVQMDAAYDLMDTLQFASLLHAFSDWIVPFRRLEAGPCFRQV